jgi:Zn-dependent protease with chaperone function
MSETAYLYPVSPTNVPESTTAVSPAFKKEVSGVMGSIVLFFIVYLLLFAFSLALVFGSVYGGIALIVAVPKIIIIFIGIGLIGLGVMVFIFLIKFLFAVSRFDHSRSVEITKNDQPRLFDFISKLTKEVQTPFPKKIYLSPDVNAAVFYNSSFWSMFLPVRKNLQIGLGLVNSLNVSEFKAVMAHEFGHFSQRSMKLGSFVYNVNKIIHNMLFENTSYAGFLSSWARMDGIFAFFASITARIAQAIQWILRQVYAVVNKSYMRLSREMEFHADAVAASVAGSQSLISALRRIELANTGYDIAMQKCDDLFRQKKVSENIYHNQKSVLLHLASEFNLPLEHEIPVVSDQFIAENNNSRINYKDQWASHPATDDRVQHLDKLAVPAEVMSESAWQLFDNHEGLQTILTRKIYENLEMDKDVTTIGSEEFKENFNAELKKYKLPAAYNGFYDSRQVAILDMEEVVPANGIDFHQIFSMGNASLLKKVNTSGNDLNVLKAIQGKHIHTKTFDFDGVKYKSTDAARVIAMLEEEHQQQKSELESIDKQAIAYFLYKAGEKGKAADLKFGYRRYFEYRIAADNFLKTINDTMQMLQPIYEGNSVQIEQINSIIGDLKFEQEPKLKRQLREWVSVGIFDKDPELKTKVQMFADANFVYFNDTRFINHELLTLNEVCSQSWTSVHIFLFETFKSILEAQLEL